MQVFRTESKISNFLIEIEIHRSYEGHVKSAYEILLAQLNKEHSEIRYSALQIVDALFHRSHVFRDLLLDEFQQFYELVLGKSISVCV